MARSYDIAQFNPGDGLDPRVMRKLNDNFGRLLDIASGQDEAIVSQISVSISDEALRRIREELFDEVLPVGTIMMLRSISDLPSRGLWRLFSGEDSDPYAGRFVRIASSTGGKGGSNSATVYSNPVPHTHTYFKQVAGQTVMVEISSSASAVEVISAIEDAATASDTGQSGGQQQPVTVSTVPEYVDVLMVERIG